MFKIQVKTTENDIVGVIEDYETMLRIKREFRIHAKAVGTLPHSLQNKLLGPPFILNKFQVRFLKEANVVDVECCVNDFKFKIFKYFTELRYFVKDGMKFGCDFVVYKGDPSYCHAQAMVVDAERVGTMRLVELGRIANDCNKELWVAYEENSEVKVVKVQWVNTGARYYLCRPRPVSRSS